VLRRLKDEEVELLTKLKPIQEAIGALEKIVDKSVKKVKPSSGAKDSGAEGASVDESIAESGSDS
jgi:tetrahydromethanopterin S-methyltransferase subunit B